MILFLWFYCIILEILFKSFFEKMYSKKFNQNKDTSSKEWSRIHVCFFNFTVIFLIVWDIFQNKGKEKFYWPGTKSSSTRGGGRGRGTAAADEHTDDDYYLLLVMKRRKRKKEKWTDKASGAE